MKGSHGDFLGCLAAFAILLALKVPAVRAASLDATLALAQFANVRSLPLPVPSSSDRR